MLQYMLAVMLCSDVVSTSSWTCGEFSQDSMFIESHTSAFTFQLQHSVLWMCPSPSQPPSWGASGTHDVSLWNCSRENSV